MSDDQTLRRGGASGGAQAFYVDWRGMALATAAALAVYCVSASPVVFWGDSAELSLRALDFEWSSLTPIARGYPLHLVLCRLVGSLVGDMAFGANLVSALFAALSVGLMFELGRLVGRTRLAGIAACAAVGLGHTIWSYAGVAEVYSLHTAFQVGALLLAVQIPHTGLKGRIALGIVLGLSMLHHRMIAFAMPGLAVWLFLVTPKGHRVRAYGEIALAFIAGALPFIVLCVVNSPEPRADETGGAVWWFKAIFMGGGKNAAYMTDAGQKTALESALYLGRWLLFNLPGPASLLALYGFAAARRFAGRRLTLFLIALVSVHVVFPFRYDWTGDQYAFLVPLYPLLAMAIAIGVGRLRETAGRRFTQLAAYSVVLAPPLLYAVLGWTDLGTRLLPRLTPAGRAEFFLPVRLGERAPREWCVENLERIKGPARLHADWGDGEVYKYLQSAEKLGRGVDVVIWVDQFPELTGTGPTWISVMPREVDLPESVKRIEHRLDPVTPRLFRVLPPDRTGD